MINKQNVWWDIKINSGEESTNGLGRSNFHKLHNAMMEEHRFVKDVH